MNKTISINLGGFFFHIDEDAYQKLSRYFEAVKQSLSIEGREEIMKDIESRVAELFQERLQNEKQVIGLVEIDAVIKIMGQPEDYNIDKEAQNERNFTSFSTPSKVRKLYRDKESCIVGGVASGFGHYFNIDPVWIRLLFVIIVIAGFGGPVLIYLILMVIIPEALTTSQKLEMKGEPITISNIERKVKEGIDEIADKISAIDHQKITNTAKNGVKNIEPILSTIFGTLFKLFSKCIGALIVLFASLSLFGFSMVGIILMFSSAMPDNYIINHIQTPIGLETPLWLQGLLFIIVLGIPFFYLLLLGLKLLASNFKSIGNSTTYILIATWVIATGITISLGINEATQLAFDGKAVTNEKITILPNDTLNVKFKNNAFYSKNLYHETDFKVTFDEKNNEIIYSNNVSIKIMSTDEAVPYLQVEKIAKGKTVHEANKRAEKVAYAYKMEGNTLILNNYLLSDVKDKFRGQEVVLYLYLPKGIVFKASKNFENFDRSENTFFNLHTSSSDYIYRVANDKVKCLNCPITENNYDDIEISIQDNDTMSTIIYDENGVLVKKYVVAEIENAKKRASVLKKRDSLIKK